jgi:amidohydrolase
MNLPAQVLRHLDELVATRHDLHAHPEVAFEEGRTADVVATKLSAWGVEVHAGVGGTGVVGLVRGAASGPAIGLRADMDALPMEERSEVPYRSRNPDAFHGCGHDGHTTMLLGAARYLAETRAFPGTVVLIFQPAEEGGAGARAMIDAGLFRRFPCDELYAIHNDPESPLGKVLVKPGLAMAAYDSFDVELTGKGAHGAQPHRARDPIVAAAALVQALQTIVSRSVDPVRAAVVSVTKLASGSAYNVLPEVARLGGTIRTFDPEVRALVSERLRALASGLGAAYGVSASVTVEPRFQALRNRPELVEPVLEVARGVVGDALVGIQEDPKTGSEDFADMLDLVPGVYVTVGQGGERGLHDPRYVFNDELIPIGVTLLARIAEARARRTA